jgi:hypothetical protein
MAALNPNAEDGIVKVTLNTVYQKQLEASIDTAEIKGTLLLVSQNLGQVIEIGKDHEARLRDLEKAAFAKTEAELLERRVGSLETSVLTKNGMYAMFGVMAAVATTSSVVISLLVK